MALQKMRGGLLNKTYNIHEGKISSLKHLKDNVKTISNGKECGLGLENFNEIKEGDIIESYRLEAVKPELGA
mgnify:CR=1 FL=1